MKSFILSNIIRPDSMATLSGWNGDNHLAISSALTNSLQLSISGNTEYEAVVLPAPCYAFAFCFLVLSGVIYDQIL